MNVKRSKQRILICLTAIGLTSGGSSTVHIYTQTVHRTTQLTVLVGRLSGKCSVTDLRFASLYEHGYQFRNFLFHVSEITSQAAQPR